MFTHMILKKKLPRLLYDEYNLNGTNVCRHKEVSFKHNWSLPLPTMSIYLKGKFSCDFYTKPIVIWGQNNSILCVNSIELQLFCADITKYMSGARFMKSHIHSYTIIMVNGSSSRPTLVIRYKGNQSNFMIGVGLYDCSWHGPLV